MSEILSVWMEYCGSGVIPFLFLASLVYLLVTEKDKRVRMVLLEVSLVILVLFFFPLFKRFMDQLEDADTYYRILWLLPMTVVIAYALVKLLGRHSRIGLVVLAAVCILCGDYVYDNVNITRAENRYHLPDELIVVCDIIRPDEGEERVTAVFPSELIHYVRQYTTDIIMPYGRDMLVDSWEYSEHPLYALMEADPVYVELVGELADDYGVQYVILNRSKATVGDAETGGLVLVGETANYLVYENEDQGTS